MKKDDTIVVKDQSITATEDGKIILNDKRIESIEEMEEALNVLIKATISIVRGY